jgi:lysosomal alpha-mannosidase
MFPYADNPLSFWTGYFTSRANDKAYIRRASHNMHAAQKLFGLQMIDQTQDQARFLDILSANAKTADALGVL